MRTNVWELVNELPLLSEGEIHVWCADLNGAAVKIQQGLTILSSERLSLVATIILSIFFDSRTRLIRYSNMVKRPTLNNALPGNLTESMRT